MAITVKIDPLWSMVKSMIGKDIAFAHDMLNTFPNGQGLMVMHNGAMHLSDKALDMLYERVLINNVVEQDFDQG